LDVRRTWWALFSSRVQDVFLSFSSLQLHPSLQQGLKELGFPRPTPIQEKAIPAAIEGRDVLACAMTGSGKTAAFLLPILHQLLEKPRGTTRALVLAPTRELAAQVLESLESFAVHTPITGAAIFGGVGMGPQERAFRTGVDVLIATPGRLLDHLKAPYASLANIEFLVFDEADRMLDMGFLPDIRRVLKHVPAKRQTLFFSATMPGPIGQLAKELLRDPVNIDLERRSAPAVGITQAIYPVAQELKTSLFMSLLERGDMKEALVFTRTKHRANRLAEQLVKRGISAERIHGNRSQTARTAALAGFKNGTIRVLVATDIAARGIDIEALGHVVNFDVPTAPEDYIHRVGRTARAELTGEAFTLVAPDEEGELRDIEKAIGKRLPRVLLPDFDYTAKTGEQLEVPLKDRIAEIRKRKAEERARAAEKAARKASRESDEASRGAARGGRGGGRSSGPASSGRSASSAPARPAAPRPSTPRPAAPAADANPYRDSADAPRSGGGARSGGDGRSGGSARSGGGSGGGRRRR
jgi:ATP-dependent RNA helicase RhlE